MKRFIIPLIIIASSVCELFAAPAAAKEDDDLRRFLNEIREYYGIDAAVERIATAIDSSVEEIAAAVQQKLDEAIVELDEATVDRLISELGIAEKKRAAFKRLYRAYRNDLTAAIDPSVDRYLTDANDEIIKRNIKGKLKNISATAEVKRSYVDKFSAILSADQIRRLYNIEGRIAAEISGRASASAATSAGGTRVISERRSTFNVNSGGRKYRGSGRIVERDFGSAGSYKTLKASSFINVRISSSAKSIAVSTDDNVLEFVKVSTSGGVLSISLDSNNRSFEKVSTIVAVVPASPKLCEIRADGFASVESDVPVGTYSAHVDISGNASVSADVRCSGEARFDISGFGSYSAGEIKCGSCRIEALGNSKLRIRDGIDADGACNITLSGFVAMDSDVDASSCIADLAGNTRWAGDIDVGPLTMKLNGFAHHKGDKSAGTTSLILSGNTSAAGDLDSGKTSVSLSGFANVEGSIDCTNLSVSASGNSRVNCPLDCTDLMADVSGFSSVNFNDATSEPLTSAVVSVSGNSSFTARSVPTVDCKVTATGFSRAEVNCTGRLTVEASRQSNIYYTGGCTVSTNPPDNIRKLK
ncbi:MAG: DUF2807 domain-containing protein [Alistipes sp.]|nr:DUF2807 domain-containing protein [Alistipes sp.]